MREQFCGYDIALALKELGFNRKCFTRFINKHLAALSSHTINSKNSTTVISAPLWGQAIDWFREEHNIHISIRPYNNVAFGIRIEYGTSTLIHGGYKTYREARKSAILKAIELCKDKK